MIFEGGSRSQEEGSLITREQTGSKHGGQKLMGDLWAWNSSLFLSASLEQQVTWQIFIVLWTGEEKTNKKLWTLFSINPSKASAEQHQCQPAHCWLSVSRLFPPPPCPRLSHDRSDHIPAIFSLRKTIWTLESLTRVSRFVPKAQMPSNSPKLLPCVPGSADPGCRRAI